MLQGIRFRYKSRGPHCVGPFKRPEIPYHDRKELVQFVLYNSQIWLTLDSQFKICLKALILMGNPEKQKNPWFIMLGESVDNCEQPQR